MAGRIDSHGNAAGCAKVIFREELIAPAHARGNEKPICIGDVKMVPELTGSRGIKRIALSQRHDSVLASDIAPIRTTIAKPSIDHIPAGSFVFLRDS